MSDKDCPLISVMVPVYNAAPYLRRCLDSLINQTYPHLEILCIDDGSEDEGLDILRDYEARDSRIVVHAQSNSGQGCARNWALDHAHGEFVTSVDSDDYLELDCFEKCIKYARPGVDLINYCIKPLHDDLEAQKRSECYFRARLQGEVIIDSNNIINFTSNTTNKLFRRSIIEKYKLRFPEGLWYEDRAFTFMFLSVIQRAYAIPDQLYVYVQRSNSTMGKTFQGSDKAYDSLKISDILFSFFQRHQLWEQNRPLIKKLTYDCMQPLRWLPDDCKETSRCKARKLIRKWKLNEIFPNEHFVDMVLGTDESDKCGKYQCLFAKSRWFKYLVHLFYSHTPMKTRISILGLPLYVKHSREGTTTYRLLGVPIYRKISY